MAFWLATLLPFLVTPDYLALASQVAITALFALSLDLILGYAGIVSLGHAAFFGVGAYAAGLISKHYWGEPISALLLAGLLAGVVGYASSHIVVRFRHLALIMLTLGLGLLLHEAANSASWLTGGADGLQGVNVRPLLETFRFDLYGRTAYAYSLAVLATLDDSVAVVPPLWHLELGNILGRALKAGRITAPDLAQSWERLKTLGITTIATPDDARFWAERAGAAGYVRKGRMGELVRPGGLLAGVFYFDDNERGPPFGIAAQRLCALLQDSFEPCEDVAVPAGESLPVFAGKERWQVWKRKL